MSIVELLPSVAALSHADKFQLVQFVLAQLAQENNVPLASPVPFDPSRFFGIARHLATENNPLKGSVTVEKDIISPIGDDWDAAQ